MRNRNLPIHKLTTTNNIYCSLQEASDFSCDIEKKYDMRLGFPKIPTLSCLWRPCRLCARSQKIRSFLATMFVLMAFVHMFSIVYVMKQQPNYSFEMKADGGGVDAVVTIATGKYSAMRLVSGLREVGEYKKPIYVITDHKNVSDISHYGATPVYVDQNQPVFETEEARFAWENSKLTKVKWYKTQIFNIVPEKANIKTILFLDADVIINSKLRNFEKLTSNYLEEDSICVAYFFHERIYSPDNFNSGTGFFMREKSKPLLEAWSKEILSGKYVRDQLALDTTLKENPDIKACGLPYYMNFYTTDSLTNISNYLSLGLRKLTSTFIHPTANKNLRKMSHEVSHDQMNENLK
mmetsp:Transcript_16847/g.21884  ORF Transcript_16847/g.21884 Transcript_16847/m.21884 type:complete len:351 (+) Transcript_16847:238-1290(+)